MAYFWNVLIPFENKSYFFETISKALDVYRAKYDSIILVGEFNTKDIEEVLCDFNFDPGVELF